MRCHAPTGHAKFMRTPLKRQLYHSIENSLLRETIVVLSKKKKGLLGNQTKNLLNGSIHSLFSEVIFLNTFFY